MKVLFNHQGNLGYSAEQVTGTTLGDLLAAVQDAVDTWGEDTEVVMFQTNNGRGANYGGISPWGELFTDASESDY